MLTHAQIWNALDRLAARAGISTSGLAKKAGLDPTTFNKSKRITPDGHARWPSTESVAKSLAATSTPIDVFVQLISDSGAVVTRQSIPIIGLLQAGKAGLFDAAGYPASHGWDEIPFPAVTDEHAYALEISGKTMEPAYRDDALIVVSPAALIRRGDRVVVKITGGKVKVEGLRRRTALGALLQEKRHLDPERFGGDEVESDNKAWSELGEKKIPNASGTAMLAVDN